MAVFVSDKIVGTDGNDELTAVGTTAHFLYGYAGDDILRANDLGNNLYGGAGNDRLIGGAGNDQLSGDTGADYMAGGAGNDVYYVDDLGDQVVENAGEGIDTVIATMDYRLGANVEELYLAGTANLTGRGNDLDNKIRGNDGNNNLYGLGGNDVLFGYGGDDVLNPGDGLDLVDGGTGTDLATFKVGATHGVIADLSHTAYDGNGYTFRNVENLEGTAFADTLMGDAGANKIAGLDGNDLIRGRAGNDDLTGGAGADIFVFEAAGAANGVDVIRAYETGVDTLLFNANDGYSVSAGFTLGKTAVGSGAQFVFDSATHSLYYDADGAGGAAATLLAYVLNGDVAQGDILVTVPLF